MTKMFCDICGKEFDNADFSHNCSVDIRGDVHFFKDAKHYGDVCKDCITTITNFIDSLKEKTNG